MNYDSVENYRDCEDFANDSDIDIPETDNFRPLKINSILDKNI